MLRFTNILQKVFYNTFLYNLNPHIYRPLAKSLSYSSQIMTSKKARELTAVTEERLAENTDLICPSA